MFSINRTSLHNEANQTNAKQQPVRSNQIVFDAVKLSFANLIDSIAGLATYNAAHWACNIDRWHNNLNTNNTVTYKRGDIIFLDLGAQNFSHEPSYTHACIVLADRYDSILVVPCSTKQYGTNHTGIIDATSADGFLRNTGIQSESFRWVSKNRVVSNTGNKVSPTVLDKLDQVLLSFAPSVKKQIKQKDILISDQKEQISSLQEQISSLQEQLKNLSEDNKKSEETDENL